MNEESDETVSMSIEPDRIDEFRVDEWGRVTIGRKHSETTVILAIEYDVNDNDQ